MSEAQVDAPAAPDGEAQEAVASESTAGPKRGSVAFIFVTVALDTIGIGLIIPVAPRLVASFLGGDLSAAASWFGWLFTLYSTMQFFFAPVLGGLSDRFGRRPVIFGSLLGAALSYLASALAPQLWWLFAGRAVAGITGASFSAAGSYVADVTPPERRAQSFGIIGAAFGLGFILGPAIGALLGHFGLRVPYFFAAGLNFVNLLYGLFVLPESLPASKRRPFSFARANPFGAFRALTRNALVRGLTVTMACGFLAQFILQSVWALLTQARFGWSLGEVGASLTVVGFFTAVVQALLVRLVVARLGERKALLLGLTASTVGFLAFALAGRGWLMYVFIVPFVLGGLAGPATQAMVSREVPANEQGEISGAISGLQGIAMIVAPIIGTQLLAAYGTHGVHPYVPGAPFFASAVLSFLGLLFALRLFARQAKLSSG
jgi:DHA1 family tetracycline resistance protein-like MFS transporter